MKRRTLKKKLSRRNRDKRILAKRERGNHLSNEPHTFYKRFFKIDISREVFNVLQASHFTYYYMT